MYATVVQSESKDGGEVINASVVSVQGTAEQRPAAGGLSNWRFDLFDLCGDCGSFWAANCCTPCTLTRLAGRVRYYPGCFNGYTSYSILTFIVCAVYFVTKTVAGVMVDEGMAMHRCAKIARLLAGLTGVFIFYMVYRMRTTMRRKYNIYGDDCTDLATTCCCGPCSLAQMSREVDMPAKCCCDCQEPEEYFPVAAPDNIEMTPRVTVAMIV